MIHDIHGIFSLILRILGNKPAHSRGSIKYFTKNLKFLILKIYTQKLFINTL